MKGRDEKCPFPGANEFRQSLLAQSSIKEAAATLATGRRMTHRGERSNEYDTAV